LRLHRAAAANPAAVKPNSRLGRVKPSKSTNAKCTTYFFNMG